MANTLIDPSTPDWKTLLAVLKGFYDLQNFMQDFWGDHIINFMISQSAGNKELAISDLHLLNKFQQLGRGGGADGAIKVAVQLLPQQMEQLSALEQVPKIQELVRRFISFRASLKSDEYVAMSAEG